MRSAALAFSLSLVACGGAGPEAPPRPAPAFDVERLFPSALGTAWSYDVTVGEGPLSLVVARVVQREGDRVAISVSGSEPNQYQLRDDGVFSIDTGTYVLRFPLVVGSTWPSRGGGRAGIARVDAVVETGAGRFEGCAVVREARPSPEAEIETSYCPGVGVARIEVRMRLDEGELRTTSRLRGFAEGER